ncbi:methyl-accepting chemotaxis protein [Marinicrinis lubricantis]|uniref:Methyl-accepting chemotaxis protein n=1 Tax=Marinicrinis lubricantis TaxID=2086470 RepID=A0ABW1IW11_9BACL
MKWNLKTKLLTAFLALAIVPIILLFVVSMSSMNSGNQALMDDNMESTTQAINSTIEQVSKRLLAVAEVNASKPELQEAVMSRDRNRIKQVVAQLFQEAQASNAVDVFEIGDKDGVVLFRGHNPEKYGDDKSAIPAIQKALEGQSIGGLEFGSSGISIRAFVPLHHQGEVIGTLQISADDTFLDEMNHTLGVELSLYNASGMLVKSNRQEEQAQLGQTVLDEERMERIKTAGLLSETKDCEIEVFSPLYDPSKTELIGLVKYSKDISAIVRMRENFMTAASVLGIIVVIIAAVAALLLTRSVTRPIDRLAKFMVRISEADLRSAYDGKMGKDEIGSLAASAVEMSRQLRSMIEHIQGTAQQVSQSSQELSVQSRQMASASGEVAELMGSLSSGAESQMMSAEQTSNAIDEMSAGMMRIADSSAEVSDLAQEADRRVNAGHEQIQLAADQMETIRDNITATAQTIHELSEQAAQIDVIIAAIGEISEQVNLLSLNASIEAARAGEYGQGFAVVAHEIKKLAGQTQASADQIAQMMKGMQLSTQKAVSDMKQGVKESEHGMKAIQHAGTAFQEILTSVNQVASQIGEISAVTEEISAGTEQVSAAMTEMVQVVKSAGEQTGHVSSLTQEQLASAEEMTASADQLREMSEQLKQLVEKFKL